MSASFESAFVAAVARIACTHTPIASGLTAAYLKTWIARLKSDSHLLVSATSQAQKAVDFIQGKAPHQLAEA
jgi:antirestriction protein ArdC